MTRRDDLHAMRGIVWWTLASACVIAAVHVVWRLL